MGTDGQQVTKGNGFSPSGRRMGHTGAAWLPRKGEGKTSLSLSYQAPERKARPPLLLSHALNPLIRTWTPKGRLASAGNRLPRHAERLGRSDSRENPDAPEAGRPQAAVPLGAAQQAMARAGLPAPESCAELPSAHVPSEEKRDGPVEGGHCALGDGAEAREVGRAPGDPRGEAGEGDAGILLL